MKDLILEIPNFIPEKLCNHLIEKFDNDPQKTDGIIVINEKPHVVPELKNTKELKISNFENWRDEDNQISQYIKKAVKIYKSRMKDIFKNRQLFNPYDMIFNINTMDNGYLIHKSEAGSKCAWHYDGGPDTLSYVLIIIYLNTIEPKHGGETEFLNGRKIRPETGKLMICPASWTYPHCGNEVKMGSKYLLTSLLRFNI